MAIVYLYKNCDTCRKAAKWLAEHGVQAEQRAIRETPPSIAELKTALAAHGGDLRKLFNTSGGDYRELGLKDRLPEMSEDEALALLASNGNLVKRPFYIDGATALNGFQSKAWENQLL